MAEITCQFVRPDRLLYKGPVDHLVLVTQSGELGVWPGHAAEICALGDGVVRLYGASGTRDDVSHVVVSGGYAEIENDSVIILANHARLSTDIDPEVVEQTREEALATMGELEPEDHRRAYYANKVKWCNLLLAQVKQDKA